MVSVCMVKVGDTFSSKLEVLLLVVAHWNVRSSVVGKY
jgi:hypothetical protein